MSAPEWPMPDDPCIVVERSMYGPDILGARWCSVAKVGRTHFTVDGVREGFSQRDDLPLVKFRVTHGRAGTGGPHPGASDSRMEVYPPDDADGLRKLAGVERARAEDAVRTAFDAWDRARRTQPYSREVEGDRVMTLIALQARAIELDDLYKRQGIRANHENVD